MSQNRLKIVLNPFTGEFQLVNDPELGTTTRNVVKAPFKVLGGYTRMYPNMYVPDDTTIEVEDDGELIVP